MLFLMLGNLQFFNFIDYSDEYCYCYIQLHYYIQVHLRITYLQLQLRIFSCLLRECCTASLKLRT